MRLMITGGCGFLGSNLAFEALLRGETVMLFDNLSRTGATSNLKWLGTKGKIIFQHGDIRNANDVASCIESFRPDVIFHLAGQVAMTSSIINPRLDFEINAVGALNLLEAVRSSVPEASVIYSSTNKVYGDLTKYKYVETETRYMCTDYPSGFDENIPLDFFSPYGCSKGSADQYMLDYARTHNLNTVVFRHSSMYGGRQFSTYDQGWIGWFCQKAIEKVNRRSNTFTISGTGKQVRDVLHAQDMNNLYFAAVENISVARGQAFNIGGGIENSLSLLELFDALESMLGISLEYNQLPMRPGDQPVFVADISKAKKLLKWSPGVSVRAGLELMIDWVTESYEKSQH